MGVSADCRAEDREGWAVWWAELVRREQIERRTKCVEHLGGEVARQVVPDDVPLSAPGHRRDLAEYPQVVAGRRTAAVDDHSDIAGGKFGCLERADDLEAGWIAETHKNALGLASGARRQHARLSLCDRTMIDYLLGSYESLPAPHMRRPRWVRGRADLPAETARAGVRQERARHESTH